MADQPAGKTFWEMLREKAGGNGTSLEFYNPLDFRIGSMVPVAKSRPEFLGYDFSVKEAREYLRRLGTQEFRFTDYVLVGIDTKTFDAERAITVRLRAVMNQAGGRDVLLLRLEDELAFDPGFLEVVKDATGIFEINDEKAGTTDRFTRINDVRDSYEATLMVVTGTDDHGKAPPGKVAAGKCEYWDYWREVDTGDGKTTKKQFLFVEMNPDSGWFQLWRAEEFFF